MCTTYRGVVVLDNTTDGLPFGYGVTTGLPTRPGQEYDRILDGMTGDRLGHDVDFEGTVCGMSPNQTRGKTSEVGSGRAARNSCTS